MDALKSKAREVLESGKAQVVICFGAGSSDHRSRPLFLRKPEQTDQLIWDAKRCWQNLAVYVTKAEVKSLGKPAVVGNLAMVKTLLQFAAESQIAEGDVIALAIGDDGAVSELGTFAEMEKFVAGKKPERDNADLREKLAKMSHKERWEFWQQEFSRCLKCYACRAACPMCYCTRCVSECNQPQWVSVPAHGLGVFEWHVSRAMHMAGRCIGCDSCVNACPADIPLNLLTQRLSDKLEEEFGQQPGCSSSKDFALSTFKPDDKENFIR